MKKFTVSVFLVVFLFVSSGSTVCMNAGDKLLYEIVDPERVSELTDKQVVWLAALEQCGSRIRFGFHSQNVIETIVEKIGLGGDDFPFDELKDAHPVIRRATNWCIKSSMGGNHTFTKKPADIRTFRLNECMSD